MFAGEADRNLFRAMAGRAECEDQWINQVAYDVYGNKAPAFPRDLRLAIVDAVALTYSDIMFPSPIARTVEEIDRLIERNLDLSSAKRIIDEACSDPLSPYDRAILTMQINSQNPYRPPNIPSVMALDTDGLLVLRDAAIEKVKDTTVSPNHLFLDPDLFRMLVSSVQPPEEFVGRVLKTSERFNVRDLTKFSLYEEMSKMEIVPWDEDSIREYVEESSRNPLYAQQQSDNVVLLRMATKEVTLTTLQRFWGPHAYGSLPEDLKDGLYLLGNTDFRIASSMPGSHAHRRIKD